MCEDLIFLNTFFMTNYSTFFIFSLGQFSFMLSHCLLYFSLNWIVFQGEILYISLHDIHL